MISILLNVVGGSAKRRDMTRDINHEQVIAALCCGQLVKDLGSQLSRSLTSQIIAGGRGKHQGSALRLVAEGG